MEIGERIKELRKAKGLTQQKFAEQIGLKRNTIGNYEINLIAPSDRTIADICREFNVNEKWLRTGDGKMFRQLTRDQEIAAFVGGVLAGENDNFKRRFIAMLSRLNDCEWELLEKMMIGLTEIKKED